MKQILAMNKIVKILESCKPDERADVVLCLLSFLRGYSLGLDAETVSSPTLKKLLKEEQELGRITYARNKETK